MAFVIVHGDVFKVPDNKADKLVSHLKGVSITDDPLVMRSRFLSAADDADKHYYDAFEALGHERQLAR